MTVLLALAAGLVVCYALAAALLCLFLRVNADRPHQEPAMRTLDATLTLDLGQCPSRPGYPHCRHVVDETRTFGRVTERSEQCCYCGETETVAVHTMPATLQAPAHGPFALTDALSYGRGGTAA